MKWSETVVDYYPVNPRSRYGHGLPTHRAMAERLTAQRPVFAKVLHEIEAARTVLHALPHEADPTDPTRPYWKNVWFTALDAAALVGLLLARAPRRYLEIGSGFSTKFANYAKVAGGLDTEIMSIDPRPRAEIDALCKHIVRKPLEDCDQSVFDELEAGDILFYDGSHRVFTNSDVTVFFLEILPRLKPGVLVHIHDIFLPDDYPPSWGKRLYSEQYMLAPLLMTTHDLFEVTMPAYFVSRDEELGPRVRALFRAPPGGKDIPFVYPNGTNCPGASFWLTVGTREPATQRFALPPPEIGGTAQPQVAPMPSLDVISRRMRDLKPRTILDVGANAGVSTQQLRMHFRDADILAFEPVPGSFETLRETAGSLKRTELLPMALGRQTGTALIQARPGHPMNRFLRKGEPIAQAIEVPVTTGTAFCRERGIETIDFLNIDTVQDDREVLAGFEEMLARRAIRVVQIRAGLSPDNDRHLPLSGLLSHFGRHGYLLLNLFDELRRNHRLPAERQQLTGMWAATAVFVAEDPASFVAPSAPASSR